MEEQQQEGFRQMFVQKIKDIIEWWKPNPGDTIFLKIIKTIYKSIAVLILIALSPVLLVVLVFVFFAAV